MNDFNNLKNTLAHEKDHNSKRHGFRTITYEEHANVYLAQMDDKTYGETTPDYRKGQAASFAKYVLSAHYKEDANSTELLKSFNSKSKEFTLSLEQGYKLDKDANILDSKLYIKMTDSDGNTYKIDYDKDKKSN